MCRKDWYSCGTPASFLANLKPRLQKSRQHLKKYHFDFTTLSSRQACLCCLGIVGLDRKASKTWVNAFKGNFLFLGGSMYQTTLEKKNTAPFNTPGEQKANTSKHLMGWCHYHFSKLAWIKNCRLFSGGFVTWGLRKRSTAMNTIDVVKAWSFTIV